MQDLTDHLHHRVGYTCDTTQTKSLVGVFSFSIVCTERVYLISLNSYFILNEYFGIFPRGSFWKYCRAR